MRRVYLPFFLLVCAAILICGSCSKPVSRSKGEITVVFVPKITGNAFFEAANAGAQKYAAKTGFKVLYQGSPEASIDSQISIISKAIDEKADGLCVSSLDAEALDSIM
jgi:AI-2 transport system substrate-binding protein